MKPVKNYNIKADIIRVVAIFFVLIVHAEPDTSLHTVDWWLANFFVSAAKVAVPLFIMLSGYLLLDENKSYALKEFYKKRFFRIGIPLIFWPLFYYFSFLILTKKTFSLGGFFNDYIFLNTFYHLYFLYIIAGLYLITPFIKRFVLCASQQEKRYAVYGSLLLSAIVTGVHYYYPRRLDYWSVFTVFIPFIPYYLAGDYFRHTSLSKKTWKRFSAIYVGLAGLTVLCKYAVVSNHAYSVSFLNYFSDVLSVFVMLMSLILFILFLQTDHFQKLNLGIRSRKFIKQISCMAFGIYLIHPIFLYMFNKYIHIPHVFFYPLIVLFLVKPIVIFGISYIAVWISKRIPFVALLFD